jgi:1-pyrroline-5-carboxylate dehydrogenase
MKAGKKLTYVDLLADETIHAEYEKALEACNAELGHSHPLYIGGAEIFADNEFEVRSPFDARIVVGKFQDSSDEHIRAAIESAGRGFELWKKLDWSTRVEILQKTATILERKKFLISALITFESGKNRYEAIAEVSEAVDSIRYYAGIYRDHGGFITSMVPESNQASSRSLLKPYGIWAVISPFNFPIALITGMSAAALLTGNCVIMKPASAAPFSSLKLYEAYRAAGVPPEVLHYLTGNGATFGTAVVHNPDISGIAFTGSRDVGLWIQRAFIMEQPYPKPVVSEMGSKNPVIVTSSADLDGAIEGILKASFGFSGQKCSATSRVFVHETVAGTLITGIREKTKSLIIGDPRKKETFIGPVIDKKSMETFQAAVRETESSGGTIVTGGGVLTTGDYRYGYFVEPTIVTGLPKGHPLLNHELFVPFLIIDTFRTLEEALEKANATDYGLTAGIFSQNDSEIDYFFEKIQSGVTYANRRGGATTGAWPGSQSFVGWHASGSTGKGVGGPYYLLSFVREQAQTRIGAPLNKSGL